VFPTQWHLFLSVAVSWRNLPQNIRVYVLLKNYVDIIFPSFWIIKTSESFKAKKGEYPPHSIRKSLDILSHLTVSALPLSPPAVENRTAILVLFPTNLNTVAFVYLVMSLVTSKYPNAPWMPIRNKRIMKNNDKSQCDSTGKIMIIWKPVKFYTQNLIWQTVIEIFKNQMRKHINRKFIFVSAMKLIFSYTIDPFKYNSVCTTILNGFTLLSDFMSLSSTKRKIQAWEQI